MGGGCIDYWAREFGLDKITDQQLIERFNADVGKQVGIAARFRFHAELINEFKKRGIDISEIHTEISTSYVNKIELIGKKVFVKSPSRSFRDVTAFYS